MSSFTSREFRDALSAFATGVTIVTAKDASGHRVGMTASSFNSVSMEPPLVLWSVTKTSHSAEAFRAAEHFCIHVLSTDQTALSNRFAKSGADKFAGLEVGESKGGAPTLPGALARFDCKTWAVYEGGDHWIIVGEVQDLERAEDGQGLVFSAGSYAMAVPLTATGANASVRSVNPIEDTLLYQLSRSYHALADSFYDMVDSAGISRDEWRVLSNLANLQSVSKADLAKRTYLGERALAEVLTGLEGAGLAVIDADKAVGTEAGHKKIIGLIDEAKAKEARLLIGAPNSDREALMQALEGLH